MYFVSGIDNTVGGYITIQILTKEKHLISDFSFPYRRDYNCLNDQLTYSFAKNLNENKEIRFIDNLAMIIKNIGYPFNRPIQESILNFAERQIHYLFNENILDFSTLNSIIELCNAKYSIELAKVVSKKEQEDLEIIFDDESIKLKIEYYLQFFT